MCTATAKLTCSFLNMNSECPSDMNTADTIHRSVNDIWGIVKTSRRWQTVEKRTAESIVTDHSDSCSVVYNLCLMFQL